VVRDDNDNEQISFRARVPAEDELVGADPHFSFHALVATSSPEVLVDAVYGVVGAPAFLEAIHPQTGEFISGEAFALLADTNFTVGTSVYHMDRICPH